VAGLTNRASERVRSDQPGNAPPDVAERVARQELSARVTMGRARHEDQRGSARRVDEIDGLVVGDGEEIKRSDRSPVRFADGS